MMKKHVASGILKKAWAGKRFLALAGICSVSLMAGAGAGAGLGAKSAQAMDTGLVASHIQKITYELYAGGIDAVRAELNVAYSAKDRYSLELFARTQGFLAKLVPWSGTFETHGWRMNDGKERPELHKSTAIWDGEEDVKEYKYGKDGSFKSLHVVEAGHDETPETLDDELVQGTTDALTASLQAMKKVAQDGVCEGSDEIFDGKRRYKLVFRHMDEEKLSRTDYNVYEGLATRCEVEVVPVKGEWHKKPRGWASIQEQGRDKGSLPTVWLAKIDTEGPAVPVKMRVKTDYGTLFMHMIAYENGEKTIKAVEED